MSQINDKFQREIADVINKHGIDNECSVPDYIIAEHVAACIRSIKASVLALRVHEDLFKSIDRTTGPSVWRGDGRAAGHSSGCAKFNILGGDCACPPETP